MRIGSSAMSSRLSRSASTPIVGVGTPYRDILDLVHDRGRIEALTQALDISRRNIGKDSCGTWSIAGYASRLQTFNKSDFLLYVSASSSRKWGAIKRKAKALGLELTQDGDNEGCFRLTIPNPEQAKFLRRVLGLRKRKQPSVELGNKWGVSAPQAEGFA
ncbi:MAG: hypothetical protein ACRD45_21695 [Bryobacteraceae bacterium]